MSLKREALTFKKETTTLRSRRPLAKSFLTNLKMIKHNLVVRETKNGVCVVVYKHGNYFYKSKNFSFF